MLHRNHGIIGMHQQLSVCKSGCVKYNTHSMYVTSSCSGKFTLNSMEKNYCCSPLTTMYLADLQTCDFCGVHGLKVIVNSRIPK